MSNGLVIISFLLSGGFALTYIYRILTDHAFTTSKYNSHLTTAFYILGVVFGVIGVALALMENYG